MSGEKARLRAELIATRDDARQLERRCDVLVAMVVRAVRECPEPVTRRAILTDLLALLPTEEGIAALDDISGAELERLMGRAP